MRSSGLRTTGGGVDDGAGALTSGFVSGAGSGFGSSSSRIGRVLVVFLVLGLLVGDTTLLIWMVGG